MTPDDVDSPILKVGLALRESVEVYEKQERLRKAQRAKRFTEAQVLRQEIQDANWKQLAKSQLKGEYEKLGIEPLKNKLPMEVFYELDQEIRTSEVLDLPEAINLSDALEALFTEGKIFRPYEIRLAQKQWGAGIATMFEAVRQRKTNVMDYLSLPKATAASMDLSRTGRQNILLIGDPKLWFRGLVTDEVDAGRQSVREIRHSVERVGARSKLFDWDRAVRFPHSWQTPWSKALRKSVCNGRQLHQGYETPGDC